jgi:hypothetical protein
VTVELKNIIQIHSDFQRSIHTLDSDLNFWNHFVTKWAIPEYQKQNISQVIHYSAYSTYDSDINTGTGYLKLHKLVREIHSDDLMEHSDVLFNWVKSLSIVRVYNALEILLLQTIDTVFFKSELTTLARKVDANRLNQRIVEALNTKANKINNRHLIQFLCENSDEFSSFISMRINKYSSTTWDSFFYLISVLRHVVVHQAMLINVDLLNEIKSKDCKDTFNNHFDLIDLENGSFEVQPVQSKFDGFIGMTVQFAVNTLKFVAKQADFKFLDMK